MMPLGLNDALFMMSLAFYELSGFLQINRLFVTSLAFMTSVLLIFFWASKFPWKKVFLFLTISSWPSPNAYLKTRSKSHKTFFFFVSDVTAN